MLLGRREHGLEASSADEPLPPTRGEARGWGALPASVGHTPCLFFPKPTHLADFNQVQTIQYSNSDDKDRKGMLQLKVAGAPEVRTRRSPRGGEGARDGGALRTRVRSPRIVRSTTFPCNC